MGQTRLTAERDRGTPLVVPVQRVEIGKRNELHDALAEQTRERLSTWGGLRPTRVERRFVIHLDLGLSEPEATRVMLALVDPVSEIGAVGMLADPPDEEHPVALRIGFLPGVTDSVGTSVKRAAEDCLGRTLEGRCYASSLILVWGVTMDELVQVARQVLYNPLIEQAKVEPWPRALDLEVPRAGAEIEMTIAEVPLRDLDDDALLEVSERGVLALNLAEMRAIAAHYRGLGRDPTDAELECIAQTWSEHCKHKIFAAPIDYEGPDGEIEAIEEGLFKRFIRGATESIAAKRAEHGLDLDGTFLVSVFHDNAGVVRFTDEDHLVYKVETHNSPSALDPYGGAMTGIVGVNRDSFGTGLGADLLTNVWGYCFADPTYDGEIPPKLMHPRRLRDGVHRGVIDGGNHSGIPYSRGFELFDDRYLGKPLVFCGTVAVMPVERAGRPTHEKPISVGDAVVMVGGRIGKDGIHGATFSSVELNEASPVQAVQIGDPITQKMMFDMLAEARDAGWMSGMTDNGAGGLSSSVGEMAEATGGVRIDLAAAPLKYAGLQPWEILISEAQERMTVAIPQAHLSDFLALAAKREVEATVLGEFTDHGKFEVMYGDQIAVDLALSFLHDGLPRTRLSAKLEVRNDGGGSFVEPSVAELATQWTALLARPNLASNEHRVRHYDHEVKALSVVKPLIGRRRNVPATASVMRVRYGRSEGVVLGEGVHPYLSDFDARVMAQTSVDEGVRRVLAAGARLDRLAALDNFCWPDPIVSDKTPDGRHKLAQLVEACRGLRDACEVFEMPLISGKDSMKNDANLGGRKISIPPTLLVSVMGQMEDVRQALTLTPRAEGDLVWLIDPSPTSLVASEWARMVDGQGLVLPKPDLNANRRAYQTFAALRDREVINAAHICGRGGLAIALSHMAMASRRWIEVNVGPLREAGRSVAEILFGEGTGRIVLTTPVAARAVVEDAFAGQHCWALGSIKAEAAHGGVRVDDGAAPMLSLSTDELFQAFETTAINDG